MARMIDCPFCAKLTDPKLDNCVHCGGLLRGSGYGDTGVGGGENRLCQQCGARLGDGDVICVKCGANTLTGQKVTRSATSRMPRVEGVWVKAAGGVVAVAAIVVIALAVWWILRDPVARAQQLAAEGKTLQAQDMLEAHLARHPQDGRAHYAMGRIDWANGQYDSASESFIKAAESSPGQTGAYLLAALCQAKAGGATAAADVARTLERLTAKDAGSFEAWYLLAQARGVAGDTPGQAVALEKAVSLAPADAGAYLSLGIAHALNDKPGEARDALNTARSGLENDPRLDAASGYVAAIQELPGEAGQDLVKAVAAGASQTDALISLGLSLLADGETEGAQARFEEILIREPKNDAALYYRAFCADISGAPRIALADFDAVSRGESTYAGDAAVQAARLLLKTGEYNMALEASDRAAAKGVNDAVFHTVRGMVFAALNDQGKARSAFADAKRANPSYAPAQLETGILEVKNGRVQEGIAAFEAYLELCDPEASDTQADEIRQYLAYLKGPSTQPVGPSTEAVAPDVVQGRRAGRN